MTDEAIDGYCRYAVDGGSFLVHRWKCRHPDRNKT